MERIHLTIPSDLYVRLNDEIQSIKMTKVHAIRIAIEQWLEAQTERQMAEGYIAMANENKKLLKDFESVDKENW